MPTYAPDQNGECIHCDEWLDAHAADGTCPTDPAQVVANLSARFAARVATGACPTTPSASVWTYDERDHVWTIRGRDCYVWMDARPPYCDRGRWLARVERTTTDPRVLHLDAADGWPRYYFDLERAQREIEDWLKVRRQWIDPISPA